MASSDTKSGFRLPWSSDRSHDDPAGELPEEGNQEGDAPASEDVAWPDSSIHDRLGISTNGQRPPEADETATVPSEESQRMVETEVPAPSTPATPRKQPTKLMADLSAAIRATAEAARDGALAQLDADARQVTDSIRERSTEGGTVLRKRSDDDIAGIRDWSKAEIARIREETDTRIASRKSELERELAAHAAAVDNRVEEVQGEVERFRSDMAEYFDRLDNESDPARLATMVEAMPDPPSFEFWTDIEFISAATSVAEEQSSRTRRRRPRRSPRSSPRPWPRASQRPRPKPRTRPGPPRAWPSPRSRRPPPPARPSSRQSRPSRPRPRRRSTRPSR